MGLIIEVNQKLADTQKLFNNQFPFLKMEFYMHPHTPGEGSAIRSTADNNHTFRDLHKNNTSGVVAVESNMTVTELENAIAETFGIYAQVFRKSGDVWLQTTATDSWSLEKQNNIAAEMESHPDSGNDIVNPEDRQELE